jgi:tetratricopeptide (TPR) repeat protein
VRDVYNELRRFPFVRTRAEGLRLHDAVREIMDENLHVQDSERHCELHERAAAYFEKRLEKTTGEEAERLGLERLYHRVRADEEAGIRLFQEMAEELVRYRLVNRSHALLNDVNTYPLERENSRLWREYYNARLAHLVELIDEAEEKFQAIIENQYVDPKLKAYALCDYGAIARRIERQSAEKAVHILEQIPALGVAVDSKLVFYLLELSGTYGRQGRWDDSLSCLTKARDYFAQTGDYYGLAYAYNRTKYHYLNQGIWKEGFEMQRRGLETLSKVSEQSFLRAELLSGLSGGWVWAGLLREAEGNLKEAVMISDKLNTTSLYSFRDLGLVLGLQGKLSEATNYFQRSISIARSHNDFVSIAFAKGFQGFVALKWSELAVAEHYLDESIAAFRKWPDKSEMPLLLNWWGMLNEAKHNYQFAQDGFEECIGLKKIGRIYWYAGALTGLVRVKHAQGDYAAIAPLLAEAEQLAQQYEYNDHLASLRLTHAMLEGITTDKTEINGQTSASGLEGRQWRANQRLDLTSSPRCARFATGEARAVMPRKWRRLTGFKRSATRSHRLRNPYGNRDDRRPEFGK